MEQLSAFFAVLGSGVVVGQFEGNLQGLLPLSTEMNVLKAGNSAIALVIISCLYQAVNSAITLVIIACLYQVYWHSILFTRLQRHLSRGVHFDHNINFRNVVTHPAFVLEVLLCLPHVPPGVTYEFAAFSFGNLVSYRVEAVFCVINILRCYLCWWIFVQFM
ncbi:hypothetical protein T484DRAFT_1763358, partial [Baffinella frigidus]